uniref:DUF1801 domain-containing protein n=1 Tax=Heterorhabditis bacteriophora TaxID=37862 RepID=A0A1I7X8P3_HETBA
MGQFVAFSKHNRIIKCNQSLLFRNIETEPDIPSAVFKHKRISSPVIEYLDLSDIENTVIWAKQKKHAAE